MGIKQMDSRLYSERNILLRRSSLVLIYLILSACSVGPDYRPPEMELPAKFEGMGDTAPPTGDGGESVVADKQDVEDQIGLPPMSCRTNAEVPPVIESSPVAKAETDYQSWWTTFNDHELNSLIDLAIRENLDLQLAKLRVRQARAELSIARGGFLPTVSPSGSYTRNENSENVSNNTRENGNDNSSSFSSSSTQGPTDLFRLGFDASWEIDIFGGIRREVEVAEYTFEAQLEAQNDALLTLLAEVTQNYVLLRGTQNQLRVATANVLAQNDTLEIQQTRLNAGIGSDLPVSQAEALLASTKAQIPPLETAIKGAVHRLSILVNKEPNALEEQLSSIVPVPVGPATVPPGLPSELLRRRPDIRQAERNLAAATSNVGVAVSYLFPKVTLTGSLGFKSSDLSNLTNGSSNFWSLGSLIDLPLFFDSRIWSNIDVQKARQEQLFITYRQTVLNAFGEVEDAIVGYDREQARRALLDQAVRSNERAVVQAKQLYEAGLVEFLNVLTAEQSLFHAQDQLAQSEQAVSTKLVALFKALGGGWHSVPAAAKKVS